MCIRDSSHIGISEEKSGRPGDDCNETTNPVTPCLRAIDAINPMDSAFHNALAAGITGVMVGPGSANAVGGQFAFIKTDGRRVEMCIRDRILTAPAARTAVEEAIAATVKREYPNCEVLMGTSTAGIAHAAIAAHLLGLPMGCLLYTSRCV